MKWNNGKTVVGLTGGIACGKSFALNIFKHLGWAVLSSDLIAAEILASDETVKLEIERRWGRNLFTHCGSIDKTAVARIVFSEELERKWLEGMLHPIIRSKWISFVQSCPSQKCMIELPLLFENNLQTYFTFTISIFSPNSMMIKRLQNRGLSNTESQQRIASQLSAFEKIELADFGLWGGGSTEFLSHQIHLLDPKFS